MPARGCLSSAGGAQQAAKQGGTDGLPQEERYTWVADPLVTLTMSPYVIMARQDRISPARALSVSRAVARTTPALGGFTSLASLYLEAVAPQEPMAAEVP